MNLKKYGIVIKRRLVERTRHYSSFFLRSVQEVNVFMLTRFLGNTLPYSSLSLSLSLSLSPFKRIFPTIYSYWDCILAFDLEGRWPFHRYLSHCCLAGDGRVGCRVWGHYSRVILRVMRLVELVQCIKCGGDEYFIGKLSPCVACTFLPPSSVFNHMTLVVRLQSPEEYTFLRFFVRTDFLSLSIWITLIVLDIRQWVVGPYYFLVTNLFG